MPPRRSRASDADGGSPRGRSPTRRQMATRQNPQSASPPKAASPKPPVSRKKAEPKAAPAPKAKVVTKKAQSGGVLGMLGPVVVVLLLAMLEAARRAGRSYVQSVMADFELGLPLSVSKATQKTHKSLFVVDLHCDATFSPRDFLSHANVSACSTFHCERSHVDLPRMLEGNIGLQILTSFSHVVSAPNCTARTRWHTSSGPLPICDALPTGNKPDALDQITYTVSLMGYPPSAIWSRLQRVLTQARRARSAEERSGGALRLIRSAGDLESYARERKRCLPRKAGCDFSAALLGIEGSHALEGDLSNLDVVHSAGFRLMGLQHFHDNDAGGSQHGDVRGGLTAWGAELIERLEERGWVVDLAHSSVDVIRDVLKMATKPLIVSHTGVRGVCPGDRNLDDDTVRAIARTGGMVGIGFWSEATCGKTVEDIAKSIVYVMRLVGSKHVGLGSDWDGAVSVPPGLDASGMAQVTEALIQKGVTGKDLENIMGLNALRVIGASLVPGRGTPAAAQAEAQKAEPTGAGEEEVSEGTTPGVSAAAAAAEEAAAGSVGGEKAAEKAVGGAPTTAQEGGGSAAESAADEEGARPDAKSGEAA